MSCENCEKLQSLRNKAQYLFDKTMKMGTNWRCESDERVIK